MVEDRSSQPEDENKNDQKTDSGRSEELDQVDSLVESETRSIGGADRKPGGLKGTVHKFWSKGLDLWPSSKKQKIAGALVVAMLLIGGGTGIYALKNMFSKTPDPPTPVIEKAEPKSTTAPSKLTGVEVPLAANKGQIIAVMIENSPDARPQSGLKDAGIVFEAVAEGGITRFNALFLERQPIYVGPVRSVRPYYIDLFLPFDAAIAHAGGSGEGLSKLNALHVKDLDYTKANAFHRVNSRYAPHNLYTSIPALDKAAKSKGFKGAEITSWARKAEEKGKTPTTKRIDLKLSGPLYNVSYKYDPKSNDYKRSEGGAPHMDERSHKQLAPKVVIALVMKYSQKGIYSVYKTRDSGEMFIFQDGQMQKGKWKKGDSKSQFEFFDSSGNKLALDPGQTWVTLVANSGAVKYGP